MINIIKEVDGIVYFDYKRPLKFIFWVLHLRFFVSLLLIMFFISIFLSMFKFFFLSEIIQWAIVILLAFNSSFTFYVVTTLLLKERKENIKYKYIKYYEM